MLLNGRAIDPTLQLVELDRADAEESLYEFYKGAWKHIDPSPWADSWAIDALCEHLQAVVDGQIKQLIVNIIPRIGKSSCCSVAFPAWVWTQSLRSHTSGPGVRFLHASYNDKLSLRDSVKCRRLIESPWYQERWKDRFELVSDNNTKSRFSNSVGGERLITSIGAGVTGEGGDCFAAGTRISTPTGNINIEDLRIGDSVFAFDVLRGKVVKSKIIATRKIKTNVTCTVHTVSGHRFICTPDHPIYSPGIGFVRAGEMGAGDRILVTDATLQQSCNDASPSLRWMLEANQQAVIRATQGSKARESRCLLQQEMLQRASLVQKFYSHMSHMRSLFKRSAWSLLFSEMQKNRLQSKRKNKNMSDMQKGLYATVQQSMLFEKMCGCFAFATHAGIWQFKIEGARTSEVFKSVSIDENCDTGEGWGKMRGVQFAEQDCKETPSFENIIARASHRRQQQEQSSGEPNNVVRSVSQATSCGTTDYISSVVSNSHREIEVYDIQVEGQSNFFAESVLVHNCIIIDDPQAANEVASEANVQEVIDWWSTVMPTRRNSLESSAVVIIQQRLAENDLTGHVLETEADGWTHLCLPGRFEPERSFITTIGWKDPRTEAGELLWPERFSEEALKRLEKTMGPFTFAGQIQQRPEPQGGGIIQRAWWQLWERDTYPPMDFILACLDTAYTEDTANDPSGLVIWGVFSGEKQIQPNRIVDVRGKPVSSFRDDMDFQDATAPKIMLMHAWDQHLQLHDLVTKVADTCTKFKVHLLLIENKSSGISVAQEIRRLYSNERFGVQLFDPKSQDKFARLYSVQHLFAEGIIYAPDRIWSEKVIAQVGSFGGKPGPKHDEYVDLTSMGLRHLRDNGLIARAPERLAELESLRAYTRRPEPLYPV